MDRSIGDIHIAGSARLKAIVDWDGLVQNHTWWNLDVWFGDVDLRARFWQY
jgi:hypothetical protein